MRKADAACPVFKNNFGSNAAYGVARSRAARMPSPIAPARPPRMMPIGMNVKNTSIPE